MQAYIAYLFYYPAFCGFNKIDDIHNFLCHGQFPFYLRQAFLSQLAALVKYAVSIVDVLDCFVREAAPAQTNYVYALISGRFACHKHVRRYVLAEACAAAYHYVSAYVAELVHKHHGTYVCKVVNDYFACYLGRVAYDTISRLSDPIMVLPFAAVPRLIVTFSRILLLSPIIAVVSSPLNLRSWGMALITAPGKKMLPRPMRAPLRTVTLFINTLLSPISTFLSIKQKAPISQSFPIFASGSMYARGLIWLILFQLECAQLLRSAQRC